MAKEVILIVEDSRTQQLALKMSLTSEGFNVIIAGDGIEGYNKVITERPDLIISDINLPELSGYQFCRLLKNEASTSSIPIILLTSLSQKQDRFWGEKAGADRYIVKDAVNERPEELIEEIKGLLKGRAKKVMLHLPAESEVKEAAIMARVNDLFDRLLFQATMMGEIKDLTAFINNRSRLVEKFFEIMASLFDYKAAGFLILYNESPVLYLDIKGAALNDKDIIGIRDAALKESGITPPVEDMRIEIIGGKEAAFEGSSMPFSIIYPLNIQKEVLGNISIFNDSEYTINNKNNLSIIGKDLAVVVKLMLLYEENERLTITDGLTRVYNRRYFELHLEKEVEEAKRYNTRLSMIMLDIDHFKKINDTYGHQQGDTILVNLAKALKKNIRGSDFVVRYGGEEFAIMMPGIDKDEGAVVAEKIRKIVESYPFPGKKKGESMNITISLGVSEYNPAVMKSSDDLIRYADNALYEAKEGGRNQVRVQK